MDWTLAIERNSVALKRIVAMLVAMAGLSSTSTSPSRGEVGAHSAPGGGDLADRPTLPRRLHRVILRLLRPAESAVRRLIVIAARGLVVPPSPLHVRNPKPPSIFLRRGSKGTGIVMPRALPGTVYFSAQKQPWFSGRADGKVNCPLRISLPLFDPLQRPFRRHRLTPICEPRISCPGSFNRLSPVKVRCPPSADDRLDATRLALRLQALAAALDDLPAQAHRLARWRANRERDKTRDAAVSHNKTRRLRRLSPLRPGRPPGSLRRPDHEIHDLLTELHGLAFDVLEHPDTS